MRPTTSRFDASRPAFSKGPETLRSRRSRRPRSARRGSGTGTGCSRSGSASARAKRLRSQWSTSQSSIRPPARKIMKPSIAPAEHDVGESQAAERCRGPLRGPAVDVGVGQMPGGLVDDGDEGRAEHCASDAVAPPDDQHHQRQQGVVRRRRWDGAHRPRAGNTRSDAATDTTATDSSRADHLAPGRVDAHSSGPPGRPSRAAWAMRPMRLPLNSRAATMAAARGQVDP